MNIGPDAHRLFRIDLRFSSGGERKKNYVYIYIYIYLEHFPDASHVFEPTCGESIKSEIDAEISRGQYTKKGGFRIRFYEPWSCTYTKTLLLHAPQSQKRLFAIVYFFLPRHSLFFYQRFYDFMLRKQRNLRIACGKRGISA